MIEIPAPKVDIRYHFDEVQLVFRIDDNSERICVQITTADSVLYFDGKNFGTQKRFVPKKQNRFLVNDPQIPSGIAYLNYTSLVKGKVVGVSAVSEIHIVKPTEADLADWGMEHQLQLPSERRGKKKRRPPQPSEAPGSRLPDRAAPYQSPHTDSPLPPPPPVHGPARKSRGRGGPSSRSRGVGRSRVKRSTPSPREMDRPAPMDTGAQKRVRGRGRGRGRGRRGGHSSVGGRGQGHSEAKSEEEFEVEEKPVRRAVPGPEEIPERRAFPGVTEAVPRAFPGMQPEPKRPESPFKEPSPEKRPRRQRYMRGGARSSGGRDRADAGGTAAGRMARLEFRGEKPRFPPRSGRHLLSLKDGMECDSGLIFYLDNRSVRRMIGVKGAHINELRTETHCLLQIQDFEVPVENGSFLYVAGETENLEKAIPKILSFNMQCRKEHHTFLVECRRKLEFLKEIPVNVKFVAHLDRFKHNQSYRIVELHGDIYDCIKALKIAMPKLFL